MNNINEFSDFEQTFLNILSQTSYKIHFQTQFYIQWESDSSLWAKSDTG